MCFSLFLAYDYIFLSNEERHSVLTKHLYNICTMLDQRTLYKCYTNVLYTLNTFVNPLSACFDCNRFLCFFLIQIFLEFKNYQRDSFTKAFSFANPTSLEIVKSAGKSADLISDYKPAPLPLYMFKTEPYEENQRDFFIFLRDRNRSRELKHELIP